MGDRQRLPVRSIGDHGVERVGNSENARPQRDLFPLQSARIARTIEKFLMRKHNLRSLPEEWDSSDHVEANFAMCAHDLTLFGREWPWFAQDQVRYCYLSDVVEKRGASDLGTQPWIHLDSLGDRNRVGGHAFGMAFCFGVFQVESAARRLKCVVVGLLELIERAFQLGRALFYELFEVTLIIPVFQLQVAMFERSPHAHVELVLLEGFQDVIVGPTTYGFERRQEPVLRR